MADLFLGRPRSRRYPKFNIRRDIPLAPELCRFSRFLVSHAGSWHPELASSHRRRHATGFGSVAISTAVFRTLVATTPQRLVDFFLEHDLDPASEV